MQVVPNGDNSVIPHSWRISMPRSASCSIMLSGTAEPPAITRFKGASDSCSRWQCCSSCSQTVARLWWW
ncbi:Uncharacterised protein [Chromobacterium violaceum]|uniref:Uncharacterized protein n=1 Tax=Chromobacterium violaceum TaxID=536 RepID=A0A3S4HFP3_CHRVL|nr:Uncharacterised protein [Chromobacterium violaceum]